MSGPYKGIRVLELTSTVSGPYAGMMLADQGADVIKIEPPGIGDLARFMGTIKDGMGAMFSTLNRNKKCICLDFKNDEDLEVFKKLVSTADVLIENYRPGIVKKLGIDYDSLKQIKPDLIYCSISGYGQSGPYKEKKVYDPLIQGTVGIPNAQSSNSPELIRTIIYDKVTGMTSAQAISAALFQRERGEGGQYLPISMLEAALYYNWPDIMMNHTFEEGIAGHPISAMQSRKARLSNSIKTWKICLPIFIYHNSTAGVMSRWHNRHWFFCNVNTKL